MKAHPFLIKEDTFGEKLNALDENERLHDESWLQEVLRKHPDILPVGEIEPIFHPLVPIGREVAVAGGKMDNLFISRRVVTAYENTLRSLLRQPSQQEALAKPISQVNLEEFTRACDTFIAEVQAAEREE